ncbi:MAG: imidazolonepropionase [Deinococcales bacterium]
MDARPRGAPAANRGTAKASLLVLHADQLLSVAGFSQAPATGSRLAEVGLLEDGAVAVSGETVIAVGHSDEVERSVSIASDAQLIDARGMVVLPGFVDPHTHLVYDGSREREFPVRLRGASYLEILRAGGGILATVAATRAADESALTEQARARLDTALAHGTTTLEMKSGYGLDTATELKQLRAARRAGDGHAVRTVRTFMAAHAVPPEYEGHPDDYLDLVVEEMLPAVTGPGLATFCDVFCEPGVFTLRQSRRLLEAGRSHGLTPKLHADELADSGGAGLAAELDAASADHLVYASTDGLARMADAGVPAVLLPGTTFSLMGSRYAPARAMIDGGVPVALATDANPGSSPTESMQMILNLACLQLRLSPEEAIVAATINAAHALGLGAEVGSIEVGKRADLVLYDAPSYAYLAYHYGTNLAASVIAGGRVAWRRAVPA